jgi:hypothetical protein
MCSMLDRACSEDEGDEPPAGAPGGALCKHMGEQATDATKPDVSRVARQLQVYHGGLCMCDAGH